MSRKKMLELLFLCVLLKIQKRPHGHGWGPVCEAATVTGLLRAEWGPQGRAREPG